jgi:hypothetical protein
LHQVETVLRRVNLWVADLAKQVDKSRKNLSAAVICGLFAMRRFNPADICPQLPLRRLHTWFLRFAGNCGFEIR